MAVQKFANNVSTTLAAPIGASDMSMIVADAALFPALSGGNYLLVTLYETSGGTEINHEVVKVTAIVANTMTIAVRDFENMNGGVGRVLGALTTCFVELRWTAYAAANTLQAAANLSDLASAATARTNLAISAANTPNTPVGNIAATDVQAALNELDTEKAPLASPSFTGNVDVSNLGTFTVPVVATATQTSAGSIKYDSGLLTLTVGNGSTTIPLVGTSTPQALTNKTINGSLNTISNISLSLQVTGTLPVLNGGTGYTTKTAGFDSLSPLSTKGDLIAHDGSNNVRVAVGTDGYVPTADSTAAAGWAWKAASSAPALNIYLQQTFGAL